MTSASAAQPQGRPAARSDAAAGRVSEDIAQAQACAHTKTAHFEFTHRRAQWSRAPGGGIAQPAAQANLHLWLAVACAAGCADLPHGHPHRVDELEWYRADCLLPEGGVMPIVIDHIAPTADWHAELLRARDLLLARAWQPTATDKQRHRAAALAELARALRVEHPLSLPQPANPEERIAA